MKIIPNKSKAFSLIELSIVILIIGILIAGVTQASRLIAQMRLSTAKSITKSAPVASMRNLILWYDTVSDASFDDAEEENGLPITNWYDLNPTSVTKINASSVGSARPTYIASCPSSSLPCLKFDGVDDYMDTADAGINSMQLTYIAAIYPTDFPDGNYNSLIMANGVWASGKEHFQIRDDFTLQIVSHDGNQDAGSSVTLSPSKPYILTGIDNGTEVSLYINGTNVVTVSTATASKNLDVLNIASYFDGSIRSRFLTGYIGEIIVFDRGITTEERKSIESYLTQKYTGKRT